MIFGLPISTQCKKQLPKNAIYKKFGLKSAQRESFDTDIARIDIMALISSDTVPALTEGEEVKGIYVLSVQLKHKAYDSQNIVLLSKLIPQKMVFALQCEGKTQFAIYYEKLISSVWQASEEAKLSLSGLNLDMVWENIAKSIGHIEVEEGNTLVDQIAANDQRAKLLTKIAALERKMASEKQSRRKREYFEQIKTLKSQIQ